MWFLCKGLFLTLSFYVERCQTNAGQDTVGFGCWMFLWIHKMQPSAWARAVARPQREAVTVRTTVPYTCEVHCASPGPLDASLLHPLWSSAQGSGWSSADRVHFSEQEALRVKGLAWGWPDWSSELGLSRCVVCCSAPILHCNVDSELNMWAVDLPGGFPLPSPCFSFILLPCRFSFTLKKKSSQMCFQSFFFLWWLKSCNI